MAPATSANDSEQQSVSSDADSLSLTDSSMYVSSHVHDPPPPAHASVSEIRRASEACDLLTLLAKSVSQEHA